MSQAAPKTLYVFRHAQASIRSANYDQLSELGMRQAQILADWWHAQGIAVGSVWRGNLQRHVQTLECFYQQQDPAGALPANRQIPEPVIHAGLNEFDFQTLSKVYLQAEPEAVKQFKLEPIRVLKTAMLAWTRGQIASPELESYCDFQIRVSAALKQVMQRVQSEEQSALIVTSGGVMGLLVQRALGVEDDGVVELNLALKNTALCEFRVGRDGISLQSFNTLPHLSSAEQRAMHTRV